MHSILDYVPTRLRWKAHTNGGEHAGPCPWCGGRDRFRVWPNSGEQGRYWCRQCGRSGNTITLLRDLRGISYEAARLELEGAGYHTRPAASKSALPISQHATNNNKGVLQPPTKSWRSRAWALTEESITLLWSNQGKRARSWLKARGLTDRTMHFASLGYNPQDRREPARRWGLDQEHDVYIPRGITIPWMIKSDILAI